MAHERLTGARASLQAASPSSAVSLAYYAILYAARAALSEEDKNAQTQRGTWKLFRESFVESEGFDRELFERAQATQRDREAADYDAQRVSDERAQEVVALAERFAAAVEELVGARSGAPRAGGRQNPLGDAAPGVRTGVLAGDAA